jgi:hypothetical protein
MAAKNRQLAKKELDSVLEAQALDTVCTDQKVTAQEYLDALAVHQVEKLPEMQKLRQDNFLLIKQAKAEH